MRISRFLLMLLMLLVADATAKQRPVVRFPLSGSLLMGFVPGTPMPFTAALPDVVPGKLDTTRRKTSIRNTVELSLKNHSHLTEDATVTVKADMKSYPLDGSKAMTVPITLRVEWKAAGGGTSSISSIYPFTNAYRVELSITEITVSGAAGVDLQQLKSRLKAFLELGITFQEEVRTTIDYNSVPLGLTSCEDAKTDELVIKWNPHSDAEEYELEYTFVDDYTANYGTPRSPSEIRYDFRNNSTRLRLKDDYYRLPLVYERGYILYRVRAIGRGGPNLDQPVYCKWSGGSDRGVVSEFAQRYYHNTSHVADKINWQVASTFAEEGKRSDVVKYYDGTYRERQTVSAANLERREPAIQSHTLFPDACDAGTDRKREVIAGETIYDLQGRPAVSIMPAPTNTKLIEFFPRLNLSEVSGDPYSWKDFDSTGVDCRVPARLSDVVSSNTAIGAAAYYSPNNPVKVGSNAFIPRADGYPFSVVRYLPDNTGRIAAQSGVGATFQFGQGHETRFYYAAPDQPELDRLFGMEAGDARRYRKNAVRDANGQVAVTYINPEGKTIATALAGMPPQQLQPLPNQGSTRLTVPLIGKNDTNYIDHTLITEHRFVVPSDQTGYIFDYSITPPTLETVTCNGVNLCLDCIYDVEIRLNHVESCTSDLLYVYTGTIGKLISDGSIDVTCNSSGPFGQNIPRTLDIGTYVLTKKITVNEAAAKAYVAEAFKDTCKEMWLKLLTEEMEKVDTMDCYTTCDGCDDPPKMTETCDTMYCKPEPNRCEMIRRQMLADLSPGGQYAEFGRTPSGALKTHYRLSIYNRWTALPRGGVPASFLASKGLSSIEDLIVHWRPEWAEELLYLHPEYCMLAWCGGNNIKSTLDFDQDIIAVGSFSQAVEKEYVPPPPQVGSESSGMPAHLHLLQIDPWFAGGANEEIRLKLLDKLRHFGCGSNTSPIDELAMKMAYCANRQTVPVIEEGMSLAIDASTQTCVVPDGYITSHKFGSDQTVGTQGRLDDLEWKFLRMLYLSAKNSVIESELIAFGALQQCNTLCIGNSNYRLNEVVVENSNVFNTPTMRPCHPNPLSNSWIRRYAKKQSRFLPGLATLTSSFDAGPTSELTGVTIDMGTVPATNDPCAFMEAILDQAGSINDQLAHRCDSTGDSCVSCDSTRSKCNRPSNELTAIEDLFNSIFWFRTQNSRLPSISEMLEMLPPELSEQDGRAATSVDIQFGATATLTITYGDTSRGQFCRVVLQAAKRVDWAKVLSISDMRPDLSQAIGGITRAFSATLEQATSTVNVLMVSVQGSTNCWPTNRCGMSLPLLCDSVPTWPEYPLQNNCVESKLRAAFFNASFRYDEWVDSMKDDLLERYYARCLQAPERLDMTRDDREYHFTLFYYDQAGNLVKTVPPAGVKLLTSAEVARVQERRAAGYSGDAVPTSHSKASVYRFNTLNQVVAQRTPDAGESIFLYDGLGRIVASQNAQQKLEGNVYAYARYDKLGRLVEGGKLRSGLVNAEKARKFEEWTTFINNQTSRTEITLTQYDTSYSSAIVQKFGNARQQNLRNRVASVFRFPTYAALTSKQYAHATHYSYDILGNVHTLIQDHPNGTGDKKIAYDYDLQSGKVNAVSYQAGAQDQFFHRYQYDALNRIIRVETSESGIAWETDAEYFYYRHGPVARVELGTDKVQGIDYMYTLQGWIKGVNGVTSSPETDMGQDGIVNPQDGTPVQVASLNGQSYYYYTPEQLFNGPGYGALHNPVARDAYGYVLDFYPGDYQAIEGNACLDGLEQQAGTVSPLYNGNISRMYTQIPLPDETGKWQLRNNGFNYGYDQLNRLVSHDAWQLDANGTMAMLPGEAYKGRLAYDADGNILTMLRNGTSVTPGMDNLKYHYYKSDNASTYDPAVAVPADATNRLAYVDDDGSLSSNYAEDIDDQSSGNFGYDAIGNLIQDNSEGIEKIEWNLAGKISKVHKRVGGSLKTIEFEYDALGNRVAKKVGGDSTVLYVRDGSGLVMATYVQKGSAMRLESNAINASGRIGEFRAERILSSDASDAVEEPTRGYRFYELSNHLGNVLSVVTDRKIPNATTGAITVESYTPTVTSATDYYAFGMEMPERKASEGEYRFGFNGKENDDEIKGSGNSVAFEARSYDARIGRFLSVDPAAGSFPGTSDYSFARNSVVNSIDKDGLQQYTVVARTFIPMVALPIIIPPRAGPFLGAHRAAMLPHEHVFDPRSQSVNFKGDNREFQADATSFRTEQRVRVDLDAQSVTVLSNTASPTVELDLNLSPTYSTSSASAGPIPVAGFNESASGSSVSLRLVTDAANKSIKGSPAINYDLNVTLQPKPNGTFDYQVDGASDGFPAYELWVTDETTGNSYLLLHHSPTLTGDSPLSLAPPMENKYSIEGNSGSLPPASRILIKEEGWGESESSGAEESP